MISKTTTPKAGLWVFALLLMLSTRVYSQATNASISRKVTDQLGEPLIGAAILVKNELTGFTASAVTNLSGVYILNQVPLATDYLGTCTYMGYGTKVFIGYSVNQGIISNWISYWLRIPSLWMKSVS